MMSQLKSNQANFIEENEEYLAEIEDADDDIGPICCVCRQPGPDLNYLAWVFIETYIYHLS